MIDRASVPRAVQVGLSPIESDVDIIPAAIIVDDVGRLMETGDLTTRFGREQAGGERRDDAVTDFAAGES